MKYKQNAFILAASAILATVATGSTGLPVAGLLLDFALNFIVMATILKACTKIFNYFLGPKAQQNEVKDIPNVENKTPTIKPATTIQSSTPTVVLTDTKRTSQPSTVLIINEPQPIVLAHHAVLHKAKPVMPIHHVVIHHAKPVVPTHHAVIHHAKPVAPIHHAKHVVPIHHAAIHHAAIHHAAIHHAKHVIQIHNAVVHKAKPAVHSKPHSIIINPTLQRTNPFARKPKQAIKVVTKHHCADKSIHLSSKPKKVIKKKSHSSHGTLLSLKPAVTFTPAGNKSIIGKSHQAKSKSIRIRTRPKTNSKGGNSTHKSIHQSQGKIRLKTRPKKHYSGSL